MTQNILYCFDENYNIQALASMISLLDKVSEPINIYIIHKNKKTFIEKSKKVESHPNIKSLNVYDFENKISNFPNISKSHVSEATYYRLFIEDVIPKSVKNLLYLDCDIICVKDPLEIMHNNFTNLSNLNKTIGVVFEEFPEEEQDDIKDRLNIDIRKYFNAGVMFINLNSWRNSDVPSKSLEIINNMGSELKYWDQDILNQIFNEDLYKVENELNFILDIQDNLTIPQETIFIHYAGSFKPWTTRGAVEKNAFMYMENFRKLGMGKFHLTHTWKMSSIFHIIKSIINLKIINTKAPFRFLISFIRSLQD